jgi:AbrB family looped-hinge helix DNA binding protein
MDSTTLSSKGQVVIPKSVRDQQQWPPGTVFRVAAREGGVLFTPEPLFAPTQAADAAGCLNQAWRLVRDRGAAGHRDEDDLAHALRLRALADDDATRP